MFFDMYPILPTLGATTVEPWADRQYTIPFYKMLDETDAYMYPDGAEFKTLFPENYHEGIKAAITQEFYYRQIGQYTPQKFLRRFHRLLLERQDAWVKLIESESLITAEYATRNYDMTEERTQNVSSENSVNATSSSKTESQDSASGGSTSWVSDTPDGSVSDIETYMSSANNGQTNSESSGSAKSQGTSSNSGNSSGELTENIRRYGNIGVTAFDKIIEGYRNSVIWCAFEEVIFPEVDKLFFALF